METTFTVKGMTCGHCVAAVGGALRALPGVEAADVDLATGAVVVRSAGPLDMAAVRAAVDDEGYEVAS